MRPLMVATGDRLKVNNVSVSLELSAISIGMHCIFAFSLNSMEPL